jgi:starvation-inducible DNA-binding protein
VRHAAAHSRLPEYEQDTRRDLEHVRLLADRIEAYLAGARETRGVAEKLTDAETVDILTTIVEEFEKHAWFLRASLEQ